MRDRKDIKVDSECKKLLNSIKASPSESYNDAIKRFFKQQKMLIESQMRSSRAIFKNSFGDKNFIISAREYLREIGMIK